MSNTLEATEESIIRLTPSQASRLARHYLNLAQTLREIAGEPPIETNSQKRKERGTQPALSVVRDRY